MLAGHALPGDLSVEIAINGFPIGNNYHRFVAYIGEDDTQLECLTVYQFVLFETVSAVDVVTKDLKQVHQLVLCCPLVIASINDTECIISKIFTNHCYVCYTFQQDIVSRVHSVLNLLQLDSFADCRLRNIHDKGRRRQVQLAVALAVNPSLIFLDNFITGLKGSDALILTIQLRKLASEGRTIVCNLVDPRQEVLELFDTMLVLTSGRCAYFGNLDNFHSFANRHE